VSAEGTRGALVRAACCTLPAQRVARPRGVVGGRGRNGQGRGGHRWPGGDARRDVDGRRARGAGGGRGGAARSNFANNPETQPLRRSKAAPPPQATEIPRKFRTCALVGNGPGVRNVSNGAIIDRHDAVFRFNAMRFDRDAAFTGARARRAPCPSALCGGARFAGVRPPACVRDLLPRPWHNPATSLQALRGIAPQRRRALLSRGTAAWWANACMPT